MDFMGGSNNGGIPNDGTPKRKRCRVFVVDQVAPASRKSTCAAREWKIVEAAPGKENPLWYPRNKATGGHKNLQIVSICFILLCCVS